MLSNEALRTTSLNATSRKKLSEEQSVHGVNTQQSQLLFFKMHVDFSHVKFLNRMFIS